MSDTYQYPPDRSATYKRAADRFERSTAAPSTTHPRERAYGREGLERDAGYRPMPRKDEKDAAINGDNRQAIRDAADRIAAQRRSTKTEEVKTGLKPNVSMDVDQAAEMLKDSRDADTAQAALDNSKTVQDAVDKLRSGTPEQLAQPAAQAVSEPDIEKVLAHPKVSAALKERYDAAETQRVAHEEAIRESGKVRIAALAADFPEIASLPLNQWAAAINNLGQRDLPRARQIASRLNELGKLEVAAGQLKAQKTAREQAEFKAYSAKENARFAAATKGVPPERMRAIQAEIPRMLADVGVSDPRSFLTAIQNQTTFPRASAEMLMMKAAMYDMAMKGAKPTPTRAIPPVQRPGVAAPRANPQSANLKSLSQKLANSGNIKDATALLIANRAAQKRKR